MIDLHCHLDLYKDSISLLPEVERRCEFVLVVTTSPRAWEKTSKYFANVKSIHTAIGLHPELVHERVNERDKLITNIANTKFVGEVGMDGSRICRKSLHVQQEIFNEILSESEKCGGRILSIHSRNAATAVLDIIERHLDKSKPILHWFTGTKKELDRAISLGCWFSVNPSMLSGKKGFWLTSKMPILNVLPETDGPFVMNNGSPCMPWDTSIVITQLSEIFSTDKPSMDTTLRANLKRLLGNE